jgi:hypothetical protein
MKNGFDACAPSRLMSSQLWFASIITQAIDGQSRLPELTPSGMALAAEAARYIKPSRALQPARRIELYAQQYWWRLLNALHDTYPLATRLFGYHDFNCTIAMPYLLRYPPNHWSLNHLGDHLLAWVQEEYHASDKPLVQDAVLLDAAYLANFLAPQQTPLELPAGVASSQDFSPLLHTKLYLQPSLHFFQFSYDLLSFRTEFLKESPDYWVDHDFPPLNAAKTPFVLFRNWQGHAVWDEISAAELKLLSRFKGGATITEACAWLEREGGELYAQAESSLHLWVQGWIIKKWLAIEGPILKG